MKWVWQLKEWPQFQYDNSLLTQYELEFHRNIGAIIGSIGHLDTINSQDFKIEILTQEAVSTSSIEGEILQRESVQSSIRKQLGLKSDHRNTKANEAGVAEVMVDVYLHFAKPLSHETFYEWHAMLMNGRRDLQNIGRYREHEESMQIVSGSLNAPKLIFEAPPSETVMTEMNAFIDWYNSSMEANDLSVLVHAAIAHLYFEIIHPFEDGNGRIGRALVEKTISQRINSPALNSFAKVIESNKGEYYKALQYCNHQLDINNWLLYFCKTILESQRYTIQTVKFLIDKTKYFSKYGSVLNKRQVKVLRRVFEAGIEGFKGGLSAANYKSITGASPATVTRDLHALLDIQALTKTGELKHTRYYLNLNV